MIQQYEEKLLYCTYLWSEGKGGHFWQASRVTYCIMYGLLHVKTQADATFRRLNLKSFFIMLLEKSKQFK